MAWTTPTTRATGDLVTAAIWNTDVVDNIKEVWHEIGYDEVTSDTNVTGTSSGSPTTVIAGASRTYAAVVHRAEFSCWKLSRGNTNLSAGLHEDGSLKAVIAWSNSDEALRTFLRFTPSAGSHTYSIRCWVDAGTGVVGAGTGTGGANAPALLTIYAKGG